MNKKEDLIRILIALGAIALILIVDHLNHRV